MRTDRVVAGVLGGEMTITPSDLCNVRFKRTLFGGYRCGDVDAYLERVADAFEDLIVQVRVLKEKQEEQAASLEEYRQMEDALRNALVSSQKLCEEIVDAAKREAQALIEEARVRRAQIEAESASIPTTLSQEIRLLQDQRERLRNDLLALLDTHRGLLERAIPCGPCTGSPATDPAREERAGSIRENARIEQTGVAGVEAVADRSPTWDGFASSEEGREC